MADQTDEKAKAAEQADLFGELQETDVKVADDKAAEGGVQTQVPRIGARYGRFQVA